MPAYLCHATGQLGNLDFLLGEVTLQASEDHLTLSRFKPVNQTAKKIW